MSAKSPAVVAKHSVTIRGHRTSISVEAPFWDALRTIAEERDEPLAALIGRIDAGRGDGANLSSAIRLFVLDWAQKRGAGI